MKPRAKLTAAVIALNEQANLPGWLASLDWADELLVIDGGSTDETRHIAADAGARVLVRPFDNFCRQRNYALDEATGDWVFFVDADERPTPALRDEIRKTLDTARQAALRVPIRSSIFRRPFRFSGTQDDRPVRLVRHGAGRWTGEVHETLRTAGVVGQTRGWLQHQTMPDLPSFLAKMNRYTTLQAIERVKRGRPLRWSDAWIAPAREVFRRLIWKHGWLDGPEGWMFCVLSGLSEWVLAGKHRRLLAEHRRRIQEAVRTQRMETLLGPFADATQHDTVPAKARTRWLPHTPHTRIPAPVA